MAGWSLAAPAPSSRPSLIAPGLRRWCVQCHIMLFPAFQGASAARLPDEHAALLETGVASVRGPVSCTSTFAWQQKVVGGSPGSSFLGSLLPHPHPAACRCTMSRRACCSPMSMQMITAGVQRPTNVSPPLLWKALPACAASLPGGLGTAGRSA